MLVKFEGVGMKLPRSVARLNKRVVNRIQGVYAWILPPWAVILHRGRRSGKGYRTPVLAFRAGDVLVVALLYGDESDWLRNLSAGPGRFVRRGRTYEFSGVPRIVDTALAAELARLSLPARAYCRLAAKQALLNIGAREPGFGPGRRKSLELV